jgi:hypothetical protein
MGAVSGTSVPCLMGHSVLVFKLFCNTLFIVKESGRKG